MIACPGGDFCALANARSLPLAAELTERYADLDEVHDIGDIDLHISGCINSCGHHHSGHIGILGVDKDGSEWYQVTLGGSDGSTLSGPALPGKVIGPSFAADEVADAIEAVLDTYRAQRAANERFIDTVRRIGMEPFKAAANAVRRTTATPPEATEDPTHEIHRSPTTTAGIPLGGEDGPTRHPPMPNLHLLLTLEQWHAVRAHWPAGVPVGVIAGQRPSTSRPWPPTCRALALVVLQFPKWTDGRAYSQARLLRSRYRFQGEMRATGDVLVDMVPLLARTGFDAVVLRADQTVDAAERALGFFAGHYQGDVGDSPAAAFAASRQEPRIMAEGARAQSLIGIHAARRMRDVMSAIALYARATAGFDARVHAIPWRCCRGRGQRARRAHRAGHQPGRRRHGRHRPDRPPRAAHRHRHAGDRHAAPARRWR